MKSIAFVLLFAGVAAAADVDPAAEVLRRARTLAAPQAVDLLRREAAKDPRAKEVFASLFDASARAALAARLTAVDADGSLRAELEALAGAMPKPREVSATAAALADENPDGERPGGPADEPDGFSGKGGVDAGAVSAGGRTSPAFAVRGEAAYKKGPWEADLTVGGLVAPNGGRDPGVYEAGLGVQRKIGDSGNFVFAEGEAERDQLLGVSFSRAVRVGVGRDFIDSARQALTVAVGIGPNVEGTFHGTERFLSPAVDIDYTLRLNPAWSVVQNLEAEFNVKDAGDVEFFSSTGLVWKATEKLSIRAAYTLKERSEQVLGYAKSRTTKLLGLRYDF